MCGATAWGATLAYLLARNGHDVRLLCRAEAEAASLRETRHPPRAPDLALPASIAVTADAAVATDAAAMCVIAVPSQTVRENARRLRDAIDTRTLIVHATKGLERGSAKRVSEMLGEELAAGLERICALSGPNLAAEIRGGLPAATVIAGIDGDAVRRAQSLFHSPGFRVYTSHDLAGVELAGSLKNVIAIAAGIADGLGLGDNAKAGIIARGIAEITRLGVACGSDAATFAGLAGVGDTMATCYSPLSRNRRAGEAIGRGESVSDAIAGAGGVVEGVEATAAACLLAERVRVEMPIADSLRAVLFENATPQEGIRRLLEREATREVR